MHITTRRTRPQRARRLAALDLSALGGDLDCGSLGGDLDHGTLDGDLGQLEDLVRGALGGDLDRGALGGDLTRPVSGRCWAFKFSVATPRGMCLGTAGRSNFLEMILCLPPVLLGWDNSQQANRFHR